MALVLLADNAGCYLGLRCPLSESVDTVVYVDEQKMPRLDCTDAHADLLSANCIRALSVRKASYV